ncbi:MAG: L,D-transpeptidase family protein [Verrucomicrobiota bacterium]
MQERADKILVVKSKMRLFLLKDEKVLFEFPVVFGRNPIWHKECEGDGRTPEGIYTIDFKKEDSRFYKALRISYPNENDRAHATSKGLSPGGQIMIHGQRNGRAWATFWYQCFNWTQGCIALTNPDMEKVWQFVEIGTSIEILK